MTGTHHTTHKSISISSDDFCKICCRTLLNKWLSEVLPVVSLTRADFVSDKTPLYIIVLFQHVIWERRSVPANGKGEGKQKSSRYFRPEKIGKILQRKKNIKIAFHCFYVKKIPIRSMLIISWFKILNLMMDIDPNISM